ncbi:MAG: arsenate reductase (glutaredoxin) [bacterium]
MIQIYHNPRCRKSREGLAILEASGRDYEIVKYLDTIPSEETLSEIIQKLGISPIQLVRTKEAIWKEKFKGKELSNEAIVKAMVTHPKLIERPIVIHGEKAVIGRPPEAIKDIL